MEVCYLINQLAPGGAPTLLLNIIQQTDDPDIEYTVCFIEGDDTLVSDIEDAGARVVGFGAAFKFDPRALARMACFFRHEEFDVLHAHLPYSQTLGRLCARLGDIGHVVSTQHNFPERYHPLTRLLERATRPMDDATVAVSQAVEQAFTEGGAHPYPKRNGQWTTIYNGIDIGGFAERVAAASGQAVRDRYGISASVPVILSVGRYVSSKNQQTIIEAFARIEDDAHLLLVGWGPLRKSLEGAARECGVAGSVTVAGRANPIEPYYAAADVFVSASRSESFGLVLVEALAAGLPTIGPDVPGAHEVLDRGGLAVSPDDTNAFAAALEGALGTERNGTPSDLAIFDIEQTINAHVLLYRELSD